MGRGIVSTRPPNTAPSAIGTRGARTSPSTQPVSVIAARSVAMTLPTTVPPIVIALAVKSAVTEASAPSTIS